MLVGLCAGVLLVVVGFVPGLREGFEIPKATLLRAFGLGLLPPALAEWRARRLGWTLLDAGVIAWLGAEALSTIRSVSPLVSLVGEPVQREGLLTTLAATGLYCAARVALQSARRAGTAGEPRDTLRSVMLVAAAAASAYALLQALGVDPIAWYDVARYGPEQQRRPFGTLGHPNLLGVVTASAAASLVALIASEPRRRMLKLALLVVLAAVTLLTLSRAAWLGLALGAIVALLLAHRASATRLGPRAIGLGIALLAVVIAVSLALGGAAAVMERLRDLLAPTGGTGASRLEIWRSAAAAWRDRPLDGQGPGTFALVFPRFQTPAYWLREWAGLPFHAHSIYLQCLATHGVLGIAAGLAWALGILAAARSAWRSSPEARPEIAAALASLTALVVAGLFGALGLAGQVIVAVESGLLASAAVARAEPAPAPRSRLGAALGWTLAVATAVWAGAEIRAFAAAETADRSLREARTQSPDASRESRQRSLDATADVVRFAPWEDEAHRLRAEALLSHAPLAGRPESDLAEALAEARHALALVPPRAANHEELARVLAARYASGDRGARDEALREIDATVSLAPVNARMLDEAARLELILDRPERCRELAQRTSALYPDWAAPRVTLALAELALGRRDAARAAVEQARSSDWHGDEAARSEAEAMRSGLSAPRP